MLKVVFDLPREERKRIAARVWLAGLSSGLVMLVLLLGVFFLQPADPRMPWGIVRIPFLSLLFGEGVFSVTCGILACEMAYRLHRWSVKNIFAAILALLIGLMMIGGILFGFFEEAC